MSAGKDGAGTKIFSPTPGNSDWPLFIGLSQHRGGKMRPFFPQEKSRDRRQPIPV
jgi:hypothetical protein